MRKSKPFAMAMLFCSTAASADIDLDCERIAGDMIGRLDSEGLLVQLEDGRKRARAIALELCGGAEEAAQEQHETGRQQALENRLLEDRPEKAGNRRLRNLKR